MYSENWNSSLYDYCYTYLLQFSSVSLFDFPFPFLPSLLPSQLPTRSLTLLLLPSLLPSQPPTHPLTLLLLPSLLPSLSSSPGFPPLSLSQLTSSLISSLLNRYAGDTGMTDSLTARLRDLTPSLFSQDDAIASKATELVTMATTIKNRYEQLSMLRESLKVHCYHHVYTVEPFYCSLFGTKNVLAREASSISEVGSSVLHSLVSTLLL